jgi:hypothetical protein
MEPALIDVVDAIARGRVAPAEVAALTREELEALYTMAAFRLHTDRAADAVTLLAALVTLFPYHGRYWRAFGVAQHRTGACEAALTAYLTARFLEPTDPWAVCYCAELRVALGQHELALADLQQALSSNDPRAAARAESLRQRLLATGALEEEPVASEPVSAPGEPEEAEGHTGFRLADGRPLPLSSSAFAAVDPRAPTSPGPSEWRGETTQRLYGQPDPNPGPRPEARHTVTSTHTAIVARPRPAPRPQRDGASTGTARLPGRQASIIPTAAERRRRGDPLTEEITLTATPVPPKG